MKRAELKQARSGKGYFPPRYSTLAAGIMNAAGDAYIRYGEKISKVELLNPEVFCGALKDQQEGGNRLIILFRHSEKADAPSLMYAINKTAGKEAGKLGIKYKKRPHAVFLYGKDVPNWAGPLAGWIFPRLGHIPVINRGLCRESVDDIRKALKSNVFPLALAPEGQVTYHSHKTSDLEPGITHIADWAAEHGPLRILPLALAYDYGNRKLKVLQKTRARWIQETGLPLQQIHKGDSPYSLLMEMTEKTLIILEESFPGAGTSGPASGLDQRIEALNECILKEAEKIAGIRKSGTVLDRIFKLRYRGVETWYPEYSDPSAYLPWEQSRSDYESLKASLFVRCSQIVDVLEYIHTDYISDEDLNNRHCEYALNILDVINRYHGGDISTRYTPELRRALLLTGKPVDYSNFKLNSTKQERSSNTLSVISDILQKLSLKIEEELY